MIGIAAFSAAGQIQSAVPSSSHFAAGPRKVSPHPEHAGLRLPFRY
jgi:hypothetical protein